MNTVYNVRQSKKIRVIIDTDAACEADDQYAIVHALLTPKFIIKGIIGEQFFNHGGIHSVDRSVAEIKRVLEIMNITDIPVLSGYEKPLENDRAIPYSEGAEFIISEAKKQSDLPLFVLCQGAATNMAIALRKNPAIADRLTCIWIGGGDYPTGCWEFNLCNDFNAANTLFSSAVPLWQVPHDCYMQMQIGYAELYTKVRPCGNIGGYLYDELMELSDNEDWTPCESWTIGDQPAIALAMNENCGRYYIRKPPVSDKNGNYTGEYESRNIRVYKSIDNRFVFEDLFAKLRIASE